MKIGILGCGYVGGAVRDFFQSRGDDVRVFDIDPARGTHSREQVVDADCIFVCLPTPTRGGRQDVSAVFSEVIRLSELVLPDRCPTVFVKSTVLPGTCRKLQAVNPQLRIVMSPEFLTARTAVADFARPTSIVLGFEGTPCPEALQWHEEWFPGVEVRAGSWEWAELVKYARNTFYAAKVGFWNEMHTLCERLGVPYEALRWGVIAGGWVNPMHTQVPGPDGKFGFGGACLPKDSEALVAFGDALGVDLSVLRQALASNAERRDDV